MFHHFHNDKHLSAQGSLSQKNFKDMLIWLGEEYNLLGAKEFRNRFLNGTLTNNDICLTFDDSLKCQYDIAVPILKKFKVDAFFFVYSSILV